MWESFFGFKKTPFSDSPDVKQLFASEAWNQVKTRLEFLANRHGVGLLSPSCAAPCRCRCMKRCASASACITTWKD